jgi:putative hydrolase of the HAD superfamily
MGIKAVAFDYGNVLSEPQEAGTVGRQAAIAGTTEQEMADLMWKLRAEWDRGTFSAADYYGKGLKRIGKNPDEGTVAAIVRSDLESWATLNAETVKLMEELKSNGIKIAILSNMPHEFLALARKRFPIFSQVDAGIYSCELKIIKPEKGIYDELIRKLGIAPAETVFFDDIEQNVSSGAAAGLEAFLWKGAADARAKLAELGVLGLARAPSAPHALR